MSTGLAAPDRWPRVIAHADMDAFYAAIEQLDDPKLRGRPLLVGPNSRRGVVLTASYEARPYGVGSAMPMAKARRLCPQALIVPPRFERYQEVSSTIMKLFGDFSPQVEALSLDEAFLDMTGSDKLFGSPEAIGRRLKDAVREATGGLTASVGMSGSKYVAKVASGFRKPDGLTIVPPASAPAWLAPLPVSSLWGAGPKTTARLHALGFETIGQVAAAAPRELERQLGALGLRFHALARADDARLVTGSRGAISVGAERTLNEDVAARHDIEIYLRSSAERVAQRLRRRGVRASGVRVKLKRTDFRILTRQRVLPSPTDIAADLFLAARELLGEFADPGPFRLIGLAAYQLAEEGEAPQLGFDLGPSERARRLETTLDGLADRFGSRVVLRAADLVSDRGVGVASNLDFLAADEPAAKRDVGSGLVDVDDDDLFVGDDG